jgi:hypothetical protein
VNGGEHVGRDVQTAGDAECEIWEARGMLEKFEHVDVCEFRGADPDAEGTCWRELGFETPLGFGGRVGVGGRVEGAEIVVESGDWNFVSR